MNEFTHQVAFRHDAEINAALRLIGGAYPRDGFEGRLASSLASASREPLRPRGLAGRLFAFGLPGRVALGSVAAALACGAVLVGTVHHSRATAHSATQTAPGGHSVLDGGRRSFGTASGLGLPNEVVPPANDPASAEEPKTHSRAIRRLHQGRAVLPAQPAQKADGAVNPDSPFPASKP